MIKLLRAGAIAAATCAFATAMPASAPVRVGAPAPPFTITTFAKQKVKLADLRGKVVVINLWATWCGPCKAEMPMMSAFHRRYHDQGFEIYGVTSEDSLPQYQLKRVSELLSYPLAKMSSSGYEILDGLPTSYVIDRAGKVRYAKAGAFDKSEFEELILPLLKEPAPAV
jgi:cytochrome c biogenesis protein CcmG/thiol:disulfide interchange protein DsbE